MVFRIESRSVPVAYVTASINLAMVHILMRGRAVRYWCREILYTSMDP